MKVLGRDEGKHVVLLPNGETKRLTDDELVALTAPAPKVPETTEDEKPKARKPTAK